MTLVYYHIVSDFEMYDEASLYPLLSDSILESINNFVFKEDRIRSLIGKRLLDLAFGEKVGEKVLYSKYGKPYLENQKHFSISHSGNCVVLAVSGNEVGIDIEECRPTDFKAFLPYFAKMEREYLSDSTDKIDSFYTIWTKKEAILKAKAIGINDNMQDLDSCTQSEYELVKLSFATNYVCHLAHKSKSYHTYEVNISTLLNSNLQSLPSNPLQ